MKVEKITNKLTRINIEGVRLAINFNKLKRELCDKYTPFPTDSTAKYLKDMFIYHEKIDKYYNKFNLTKNQKVLI